MSVIVKNIETDEYSVFVKGDVHSVSKLSKNIYNDYSLQINQLASLGLRIMGLGYKTINQEK